MHDNQHHPGIQGSSTQSPELTAVLARFTALLPQFPNATDDFKRGLYECARSTALERRYLQWQAPKRLDWVLFDVDTPEAGACWIDAGAPPPNLVVQNRANGHAKIAYLLAEGVTMSGRGRKVPRQMYQRAERELCALLGADVGFRGRSAATNNPMHPHWAVHCPRAEPWKLSELLLTLPPVLQGRAVLDVQQVEEVGRNHALYQAVSRWAWSEIRAAKLRGGVLAKNGYPAQWQELTADEAERLNLEFDVPLPTSEARGIGRSAARQVWDDADKLPISVLGGIKRNRVHKRDRGPALPAEEARQRMAQGRQYSASQQRSKSGNRITAALGKLQAAGNAKPTMRQVAQEAGVGVATVARFYKAQGTEACRGN